MSGLVCVGPPDAQTAHWAAAGASKGAAQPAAQQSGLPSMAQPGQKQVKLTDLQPQQLSSLKEQLEAEVIPRAIVLWSHNGRRRRRSPCATKNLL